MICSYNSGVDCTTCTKRGECSARGSAGDKCEYGEWNETLSMLLEQTRFLSPLLANRIGAVLRRELAAKDAEIERLKSKIEEYERQPEMMADVATEALEILKKQDAEIKDFKAKNFEAFMAAQERGKEIARLKRMKVDYLNMQKNMKSLRAEITLKQNQICSNNQFFNTKIAMRDALIKELADALETQIDCDDDCGECEDCGSCPTAAFEWRKLVAKAREETNV